MTILFITGICVFFISLSTVNADFYGQCDVLRCIEPFKDIQQHTGSFNFAAFQQGCSLYPSALKCVEETTKNCHVTQIDNALWDALKQDMDYVCIDHRTDYLEVAPCLQRRDIVLGMKGCAEMIKRHATMTSQSQVCGLADEALDCMSEASRPCGEKAVTISYTLTRQTLDRVLESLGRTCFLGKEGKVVFHDLAYESRDANVIYGKSDIRHREVKDSRCVHLGLIIGGCILAFSILIGVIALVKIRRRRHEAIKRSGLIIGEQPPAYEDAYPAYNPYTKTTMGGKATEY